MDIWKIIGIEPTKDKDLLKKAYRMKLTGVNPEDDPEGFMQLREAYEEAVRLADVPEEEKEDDEKEELTGVEIKIDALYRNFEQRIRPEEWEALFDCDEFVALDTSEESFFMLLRYLMSHFHLPQNVWKVIVENFDINLRKKELSEIFPEDFLEYIINNASYEDPIDYQLITKKTEPVSMEEYDSFIALYYQLDHALRTQQIEEQEKLLKELEETKLTHPYLEACGLRCELQKLGNQKEKEDKTENSEDLKKWYQEFSLRFPEELAQIMEKMELLYQKYPEDLFICNCCGNAAIYRADFEKAEEYFEHSLEISPDNYIVRARLADLAYFRGEYEKSKNLFLDLLKERYYDNNVRAGMIRANQGLIAQLEEKIKEDPQDNVSRLEIAWSYYQSYRFPEAIQVLNEFTPSEEKVCEYYNVKGRTYFCLLDYEKALSCFQIWKETIEAIPETDQSPESQDKRRRYEYVNCLIGDCYLKTKRFDEARTHLDIALAKEHAEILLAFETKCELEYETKNYEACIDVCDRLIERDDHNYVAYSFKAKACLELDYFKEALNACEHAIFIYPYSSTAYVQEIKLFLKFNQTDDARNVIERYRRMEIPSDRIDFYEAKVDVQEEKDDDAIEILRRIVENYREENSDLEDMAEVYLTLGDCYDKQKKQEQALECYEHARSVNPEHQSVSGRIGIIYKRMGKFKEALKLLDRQIEIAPNAYYLINRGILYRFFQNYESALEDFNEALKEEPDNVFCYSRIGLTYEQSGNIEKALEYYDIALKYIEDDEYYHSLKAEIYTYRARVLQCLLRFEESSAMYEAYFEEFGLNADVAYDYSELLQRMNRIDDAVSLLRRCIDTLEYNEDIQACIRQLCAIYGDEGYIDRANECFMLAISKKPDDARVHAIMAERFFRYGLYSDAKRLYENAVNLDKDNKENYYSELVEVIYKMNKLIRPNVKQYIAKVYESTGKAYPPDYIKLSRVARVTKMYQKAMEIIVKALNGKRCFSCLYSVCHEALYEKGQIYEAMRDYEMARMCYQQALSASGHNALYERKLKEIEGK